MTRSVRWYIDRVQSMSAREVGHRVREQARFRLADRTTRGERWPVGPPAMPILPGLRDRVTTLASGSDRERWSAWSKSFLEGRVELLGVEHRLAPAPRWNADPVSGLEWPRGFAFRLPYRSASEYGDPKHTWELNRFGRLLGSALAALSPWSACAGILCVARAGDGG